MRPALELDGVSAARGGRTVLADVSVQVRQDVFTALIGPNGSGKSTLLAVAAAALAPRAGHVRINGVDQRELTRAKRAQGVALVEQNVEFAPDLTVDEVVRLGRFPHRRAFASTAVDDDRAVSAALHRGAVAHLRGRLFYELSGGERQRVHIARALAQEPRVLLLDEPTNHLDAGAQLETMALLRDLTATGIAVLAAVHDLTLAAAYADEVAVLEDGRITAAGPTGLVLTPELIESTYRVRAIVMTNPLTARPLVVLAPPADTTAVSPVRARADAGRDPLQTAT